MLDLSIGEVDSLVSKACRGAGFSWGLAQEAGNAAAFMALRGLPALDAFSQLAGDIDGKTAAELTPAVGGFHSSDEQAQLWVGSSEYVCPVIAGLGFAECDLSGIDVSAGVVIKGVLQPLVIIPFVARAAGQLDCQFLVAFKDAEFVCSAAGIDYVSTGGAGSPSQMFSQADVTIRRSNHQVESVPVCQRATGQSESVEVLQRYAHRTYVPASEASRNAGAGAGFLDND